MTLRGFYVLYAGAVLILTGLSIGSSILLLLGTAALSALLVSLVSVLAVFFTLRVRQQLPGREVLRLSSCDFSYSVSHLGLFPVSPLELTILQPSGRHTVFLCYPGLLRKSSGTVPISFAHVGPCRTGIASVGVRDVFGFFHLLRKTDSGLHSLLVLPRILSASAEIPRSEPGEGQPGLQKEPDYSTPESIRSWVIGDELKRIHWKLSLKRRELTVRTYDPPPRPDVLILLNQRGTENGPQSPDVVDAMTESCLAVIRSLLDAGHPVHLLEGELLEKDLSLASPESLPVLQHSLAEMSFSGTEDFARVLSLCSRRLQRANQVILYSAEITPAICDMLSGLFSLCPAIHFTYLTRSKLSRQAEKLLFHLLNKGIDAAYILL